jgi:hypothetical protein
MHPEKILSMILARKDKLLDLDVISKELTNRGRTKEEIEMAIKIACCIAFFDSLLFETPIIIGFSPNYNKDELFCFFASYYHPSMDKYDREEYAVYVERLPDRIRENKGRFVSFDENGKPFLTALTLTEAIIKIAIHEVRHRLQHNGRVKIFYRNKKYRNPIGNFVRFTSLVYEYDAKNKPQKYLKERLSDNEFDANVIDSFFAGRLHRGESIKKLSEIIKKQG